MASGAEIKVYEDWNKKLIQMTVEHIAMQLQLETLKSDKTVATVDAIKRLIKEIDPYRIQIKISVGINTKYREGTWIDVDYTRKKEETKVNGKIIDAN